jgi:hypothetical protein
MTVSAPGIRAVLYCNSDSVSPSLGGPRPGPRAVSRQGWAESPSPGTGSQAVRPSPGWQNEVTIRRMRFHHHIQFVLGGFVFCSERRMHDLRRYTLCCGAPFAAVLLRNAGTQEIS